MDLAEFVVDPRAREWAEFRAHFPRCADCSREVARFAALAAALGSEPTGGSAHPSDAKLLALARGAAQLDPDERARLEAHTAGCASCRTELLAARRFDFGAPATAGSQEGWLQRLAGVFAELLRRPAFAAVLLALTIGAGLLVWRQARETHPVASPPTAQVAPVAPVPEAPTRAAPPEPTRIAEQPAAAPAVAPPAPVAEPPTPVAEQTPAPLAVAKQTPAASPPIAKQPAPHEAPAESPPEPAPPAPIQIAALVPTSAPVYVPSPRPSGSFARVGGGTRALETGVPAPEALAPAHAGATTQPSPDLYWFLPAATSSSIEITVIDPNAEEPVLETTLAGPHAAGLQRVSLAEHGARLRPDVEYRWYVSLVRDPARRSQDVVSEAAIRYTPADPQLASRLAASAPAGAAHVYADAGFWYDAFDQLSSWLAAEPGAAVLHQHRAALLDQVGLGDAAAFERRQLQ